MSSYHRPFSLNPIHLALALALTCAGYAASASAQQPATQPASARQGYDLPPADLGETLLEIARRSARSVSFESQLVAGYRSSAVQGELTAEQAVAAALVGTDLALTVAPNGTLTVTRAPRSGDVASGATDIADSDAQLPDIIVSTSLDEDGLYFNPSTSSAVGRSEAPLQQTPQSVEVISERVIRERQATDFADALKTSSGVTQNVGSRGAEVFRIRGFPVAQTTTNGVPNAQQQLSGVLTIPIQGVERLEVIKGPDSITSGSSSPGGSINIVRKGPVTEPLREIMLEAGDHLDLKQALDLGGALNTDKTLAYRLNLSNRRSQRVEPDFDGRREIFVAPAIGWDDGRNKLTLGAEYVKSRVAAPISSVALGGRIQDLPSYRLLRKDDHIDIEQKTGYYEFASELLEGLTFNSKVTYTDQDTNPRLWQILALNNDGSIAFASPYSSNSSAQSWSTQNDLRYRFKTGILTHNLLVGVDWQRFDWALYEGSYDGPRTFPDINVWNPDTFNNLPPMAEPSYKVQDGKTEQRGYLLQNRIDIGERWHLLLAGKKSRWISQSAAYQTDGALFNDTTIVAEKWVPNYGIAFDLVPELTLYANLLNGFTGLSTINRQTGRALSPATSRSKEVGAKLLLLDDALTFNIAYFQVHKTGEPLYDSLTGTVVGVSTQSSSGYDLSLSGELLPGWNLIANYNHIQYEDPDTTEVFLGDPMNSASLWTSYELQSGRFKGVGAGIGVQAFSDTKGGFAPDDYRVPGGASTDLSLFYRQPEYSVVFGVTNLFDRALYWSSTGNSFVPMQPRRSARLTLTYNF